jgi:hypothetical protein
MNDSEMETYSSSYLYQKDTIRNELHLESDGTFTCQCSGELEIPKKGTWETGGPDGGFLFYNREGILKKFAMPSVDSDFRKVIQFSVAFDSDITFVEIEL